MKASVWATFSISHTQMNHQGTKYVPRVLIVRICFRERNPTKNHMTISNLHTIRRLLWTASGIYLEIQPIPIYSEDVLHVGTQNVCESLYSVVWSRLPKSTFFQRKTLVIGVFEAIATYNEGNINEGRILQNLGIPPGTNRIKRMKRVNALQIRTAKKNLHEIEKSSARRLCSRENYETWKRKKTSLTTPHIQGVR